MRITRIWVVILAFLTAFGGASAQSQSVTIHVVKVNLIEKGVEMEARSKTVSYQMVCKGDYCSIPQAGGNYSGKFIPAPVGTGLEAFIPDNGQKIPGTDTVAPYFVQSEVEIEGCSEDNSSGKPK